ncbi:hypothetical protein ACQKLN_22845 [Paenibacillus glucanolyticus]
MKYEDSEVNMKKFKESYPDHMSYDNETYIMNEVPNKLLTSMPSILIKGARLKIDSYSGPGRLVNDSVMEVIVNKIAEYSYVERTKNWGWDYLIRDLERNIDSLGEVPFARFMDAVSDITFNFLEAFIVDDLNEIFEFVNFGYRLSDNLEEPWICINHNTTKTIEIESVAELTRKLCKQTADHIEQAKEQLKRSENPRARKDAIRDCLSAMEALMKRITDTKDVSGANNHMVNNREVWGPKVIVTEGHKLWKLFHEDYTDIRHGDFDISSITLDESRYFIDRILSYVIYISKIALKELN